MAERSFNQEVEKLRFGAGAEFRGEGILAVVKALLQSGVAYIGGYQGAPVSHLMDVLADAGEVLEGLGVHFEASASEAAAAAMLAASINYPIRGAVTWKSTVGTNVASDALANLASAGVKGGALIVLGEDYGEGASVIQERTHAFAMKSQIWLLDPRPQLPAIVQAVEQAFALSETSATPVMLMLRVRACHVYGRFVAKNNRGPACSARDAIAAPTRDFGRIVLPPATYAQEKEKFARRLPAALRFIADNAMNETFEADASGVGIILQGGLYNGVLRALERLGCADVFGTARVPLHVLNVTYPLVPEELVRFCADKHAVLIVEEGQPEFIEQELCRILRKHEIGTAIVGKDVLPMAGEYTASVLQEGIREFLERQASALLDRRVQAARPQREAALVPSGRLAALVPVRPSGLCTGCPERPFFSAMKLLQRETGPLHVSADVGCHSFATLPPFNLGNSIMGYGLGAAGASALAAASGTSKRAVAVMGDGGFWHNGLTSGIGNAVFNRHDTLTVIIDNGYSAATGGQDILSSRAGPARRDTNHSIVEAVKGVGVQWVRRVHTYDIEGTLATLREALTTSFSGPKVIVAEGECQLSRQRRLRPLFKKSVREGRRAVRERFGVDPDVCTGDRSCIRLSGCPSLTVRESPDPLRNDLVAHVDNSCIGCGVCGEVAHAAVLCPSFYRADIIFNPTFRDRLLARIRAGAIALLQKLAGRRRRREAL